MSDVLGSYPHFRLNLEQQQKRAKELLRAARAGDANALAKFRQSAPKLAEAQFAIARELRFENWAALKQHIAAMRRERSRMEQHATAPVQPSELGLDGDMRTLHIRCGSDLRRPLQDAGFRGDFLEHSYPYLISPEREGPGCLEERARFLVPMHGRERDLPHAVLVRHFQAGSHHRRVGELPVAHHGREDEGERSDRAHGRDHDDRL